MNYSWSSTLPWLPWASASVLDSQMPHLKEPDKWKWKVARRRVRRSHANSSPHPRPSTLLGAHGLQYGLRVSRLLPMTRWLGAYRCTFVPKSQAVAGIAQPSLRLGHTLATFVLSSQKEGTPTKQRTLLQANRQKLVQSGKKQSLLLPRRPDSL